MKNKSHPTHIADSLSKKATTINGHVAAFRAHNKALKHHRQLPVQSYRTHSWKRHHAEAMRKHEEMAHLALNLALAR